MSQTYQQAIAEGWRALAEDDWNGLLDLMRRVVEDLTAAGGEMGLPTGCREVDHLLEAAGERLAAEGGSPGKPESLGTEWVLASAIYAEGGHTGLIGDLVDARDGVDMRLMLSLREHDFQPPEARASARTHLPAERCDLAPRGTPRASVDWMLHTLGQAPPSRVYLMHHPADVESVVVAIAARARFGAEVLLIHHVDGRLAVGLYLTDTRVIDLSPRAMAFSRWGLGIESVWLPITCPDPPRQASAFLASGRLVTATSATPWKYQVAEVRGGLRYEWLVAPMLAATGGVHWHFGPLPPTMLGSIHQTLDECGIDREQFRHVPHVPSLAEALVEAGVDVMLNSFPIPGGRTAVEGMAAGVPMLWHSPHASLDEFVAQMAYPGAVIWRQARDLTARLAAIDAAWLAEQSRLARATWEQRHHPRRWRSFFATPQDPGEPLPPEYTAELVQRWIHQHRQLAERNAVALPTLESIREARSRVRPRRFSAAWCWLKLRRLPGGLRRRLGRWWAHWSGQR